MNRFKDVTGKISYLTREMAIDRNTIVTLHKRATVIPPLREATYSP